jgi:hypothetical protein
LNYKLLFTFLAFELVEFTVFWFVSAAIASYFSINTLSIFLPLVGIDIISTVLVYGKNIQIFIDSLFNNDSI